jgi:hypothetical protein
MCWSTELRLSASVTRYGVLVMFYISLMISRAMILQLNLAEKLLDNPLWMRTGQSTKDADTILKVFRNISSLCEVFQVSDSNY